MYEFHITLEDDDYLLFNQYHILNNPMSKKTLLYIRFIFPFICLILYFFYQPEVDYPMLLIAIMVIVSIFWISYSKKMILNTMKQHIKKMKKHGRLPYSKEAILRFNDESILEITSDTETKTNYSLIENIAITETAIYIYVSTVQAFILPLTAFSDEGEKQRFMDFIHMKADYSKKILNS